MKKALIKVLAAANVWSFLMIGSAFATPMYYFSTTDFTIGTNGTMKFEATGDWGLGETEFGIYWVDDITGTPPEVTKLDIVNFFLVEDFTNKFGQVDWTVHCASGNVNCASLNVTNYYNSGAGVQNVPNLFGFYFMTDNGIFYTDPALSADPVTVIMRSPTSYIFSHGDATAAVFVDNITPQGSAPVPEPATMLLFGTGFVGLVGARLRKKKK